MPKSPTGADLLEYYLRFGLWAVDFNGTRYRLLGPVNGPPMSCFGRYRRTGA